MSHRVPAERHPALSVSLLLGLVLLAAPVRVTAQQNCLWGNGTRNLQSTTVPGLGRITYVSRPHLVCADGVVIWADSAVSYADQGMSDLFGHVRYHDRTRKLSADSARYFSQQDRLQAHGSLFVEDTVQGSIIRNGSLVYLRKSSERVEDQMTVTTGADRVRPHAILYMRPAADTALADTVKARPDTTHAAVDTTRAAVDTARAAVDTARAAVDTTHAAVDTAHAAVDTAHAAVDTAAAGLDTLPPAPPPAPDTTPYDVIADTIFLQGSRYFRATGKVEIRRDSLRAYADSAEYDQVAGRLLLDGGARVEGSSYDLTAGRINIGVPGGAIRDVRAIGDAVLVGQDLHLTSPTIHMFLKDGLLDRLVAVPLLRDSTPLTAADSADATRPVAVAEKFHLTADSLQVDAPGQALKRIVATGNAHGASDARDSLNVPSLPEVARTDWVSGDTVVVTFVPVPKDSLADTLGAPPPPPGDSARARFRVDRLVASGDARSLYRLPPSDSAAPPGVCPPAVHYVKGSRITIAMTKGEVDSMQVEGPAEGYHLEPDQHCAADTTGARDTLKAGSDTAATRADTTKLRTDTLRARPPVGPSKRKGGGGGGAPAREAAVWRSEPPHPWVERGRWR